MATDGAVPELAVDVPLGQRVLVLGELLLPDARSPASEAACADVARWLAAWPGSGTVLLCGRLAESDGAATGALAQHPALTDALRAFTARPGSRVVFIGSDTDPGLTAVLDDLGVEAATAASLECTTGTGPRTVQVRNALPRPVGCPPAEGTAARSRPWLGGLGRLDDPRLARRFVTSRLLYRRLRRYLWVPPVLLVLLALALRVEVVIDGLGHVLHSPRQQRALLHAYQAPLVPRVVVTAAIGCALLALVAAGVALSSRAVWRALDGTWLPAPWSDSGRGQGARPTAHALVTVGTDDPLDAARSAMASGACGLIIGGALAPELTHLDAGFFACPGALGEVVREHRGRFGLPPTFLHHRQAAALELETGADLHVRLLHAETDLPSSTPTERLLTRDAVVKGRSRGGVLRPESVASWPGGASWPPAPAVAADRVRVRQIRRAAALALSVTGLIDVLSAVTTPERHHFELLTRDLPVSVTEAAGALVAIAGIALIMLARGVLRGQRRSWMAAVLLLASSLVVHLVHANDLISLGLGTAALAYLLVQRDRFAARATPGTTRSAFVILGAGALTATLGAFAGVELAGRHRHLPDWPLVLLGAAERLVGLQSVHLPAHINRYTSTSLLAVGLSLIVITLFVLTRPVMTRRLSGGRPGQSRPAAEARARDIVQRHGSGTLDYFALRDDKQWFFHRDSVVAYAVLGGVCLVSPDPIGPFSERDHVWDAFRRYVDRNGWGLGVIGAGEEWLPTYRASGMRFLYIGDEAIVDLPRFSLAGNKMKGLRQAVHRVARYGYTIRFLDPAQLAPADAARVADLWQRGRQGAQERGFSMMLGRLLDRRDRGLLLALVEGPDRAPVAMCQFVPSPAIRGYSLDLMSRDPGEHPNGLIDFALCSTIEHLAAQGMTGLSLNFAAMRSVLDGADGDSVTQRMERWAVRRLSGFLQIESLWRFNAKFEPQWHPRYVVFDSAEQFVPVALQMMRAEALTDIPLVGRLLAPPGAARPELPTDGAENGRDGERELVGPVVGGPRR